MCGTLEIPGTISVNYRTHRLKRLRLNVIGVSEGYSTSTRSKIVVGSTSSNGESFEVRDVNSRLKAADFKSLCHLSSVSSRSAFCSNFSRIRCWIKEFISQNILDIRTCTIPFTAFARGAWADEILSTMKTKIQWSSTFLACEQALGLGAWVFVGGGGSFLSLLPPPPPNKNPNPEPESLLAG